MAGPEDIKCLFRLSFKKKESAERAGEIESGVFARESFSCPGECKESLVGGE